MSVVDLFANAYAWLVSAGGTGAPAAGTVESWTISNPAGAPAASPSASPPAIFRVADQADTHNPPEIIQITNVVGGTWTAKRGAEGPTVPWAHAANWTAVPIISAAGFANALLNAPANFINVMSFGAQCDGTIAFDVHTAGTTFTSASLVPFTGSRTVIIDGGGASGDYFQTTMTCTVAGTGTLGAAPTTAVTGACAVWGTDDSTAWAAALEAAYLEGGNTLWFPGISIVAQPNALNPPNNGVTSTPYNGGEEPNTITYANTGGAQGANAWGPWQPAIRITGRGPYFDGQWGGKLLKTGSILVIPCANPTGGNPAKLCSYGVGSLELDHVTVLNLGNPAYPMFYGTNTVWNVHDLAICGQPSKVRKNCNQDVFLLGGTSTLIGAGINAPWQGYGSKWENIFFDRIRKVISTGQWANGVNTKNLIISATCGSNLAGGAPFNMGQAAHKLGPDVIEMMGYQYAYVLDGCVDSTIEVTPADGGNGTGDQASTLGVVNAKNTSQGNIITSPYAVGVVLTEDASSKGSNTLLAPRYYSQMGMTATGSYVSGTIYQAPFNQILSDPFSMADVVNHCIKITQTGKYRIEAQTCWDVGMGTSGQVGIGLYIDGTASHGTNVNPTIQGYRLAACPLAGSFMSITEYIVATPTAPQYISVAIFQTTPSTEPLTYLNCYLTVSGPN